MKERNVGITGRKHAYGLEESGVGEETNGGSWVFFRRRFEEFEG